MKLVEGIADVIAKKLFHVTDTRRDHVLMNFVDFFGFCFLTCLFYKGLQE